MAVDPYAAPKSRVADVRTIDAEGNFVVAGRSVAAGNGWTWITDAWEMVKTQKGAWIGLIVVFVVILFALNFLPIIGPLLLMLLMPVFYGGVMRGCDAVRNGGSIQLSYLFAGFREKTSRLIGVGAASLAVFAALFVIAMIVFGAHHARRSAHAGTDAGHGLELPAGPALLPGTQRAAVHGAMVCVPVDRVQ